MKSIIIVGRVISAISYRPTEVGNVMTIELAMTPKLAAVIAATTKVVAGRNGQHEISLGSIGQDKKSLKIALREIHVQNLASELGLRLASSVASVKLAGTDCQLKFSHREVGDTILDRKGQEIGSVQFEHYSLEAVLSTAEVSQQVLTADLLVSEQLKAQAQVKTPQRTFSWGETEDALEEVSSEAASTAAEIADAL